MAVQRLSKPKKIPTGGTKGHPRAGRRARVDDGQRRACQCDEGPAPSNGARAWRRPHGRRAQPRTVPPSTPPRWPASRASRKPGGTRRGPWRCCTSSTPSASPSS
ncbi:MAG: hypothetical protein C0420_03025, partial [Methylobacterium sp.]|nr:hypothetical protein [Methylobacterium sp.]